MFPRFLYNLCPASVWLQAAIGPSLGRISPPSLIPTHTDKYAVSVWICFSPVAVYIYIDIDIDINLFLLIFKLLYARTHTHTHTETD